MTSTVKVTAHCASTKEVVVSVGGNTTVLQNTETADFVIYDGLILSAEEITKDTQTLYLPHQQRVVDEQKELDDKRSKLTVFIGSPVFATLNDNERRLLTEQCNVMTSYHCILTSRILAFKGLL